MISRSSSLDERIRALERVARASLDLIGPQLELALAYDRVGRTREVYTTLLEVAARFPKDLEVRESLSRIPVSQFANYETVPRGTYAQALRNLRTGDTSLQPYIIVDDQRIARPQTVREIMLMRLNDPDQLNKYSDSCSATAYSAEDKQHVLVIPASRNLILLPHDFTGTFFPIDEGFEIVKRIENGTEKVSVKRPLKGVLDKETEPIYAIDRDKPGQIYGRSLTRDEVMRNEGWIGLAEEDTELLSDYADLVFGKLKERGKTEGMGFYFRSKNQITEAELRPVYVSVLDYGSDAYVCDLGDDGMQFVRVAQKK